MPEFQPKVSRDDPKVSPMVKGYLVCALWTMTNEEGESVGDNYGLADFSPESIAQAETTCQDFVDSIGTLDHEAYILASDYNAEGMGHDLWLTRNRHGAGFWDRGMGELGKRLTDVAHAFGECNLVAGDDGRLYLE